jgi:inorganic triphosphatase YgiF
VSYRAASRVHSAAEEREVKLAVANDWVFPALSDLESVSIVDRGDERLRAVYWDTDGLGLAHAGVGMRHRNGTWTYKGKSSRQGDALVRDEVEVQGAPDTVPAAVRACIEAWVDPDAVHPVAELDTLRHTVDASAGEQSAEVVHDRVRILDAGREVERFAEVEVEFDPHSQVLADRLVRLLVEHGATLDATPKYLRALRALGHRPPQTMA